MDRLACLELPDFPLQLLQSARPDWRGAPAAVVDRDAPHGLVLWSNALARASGVLPGQRCAAALGLCAELRAGALRADEIETGVAALVRELQRFSPQVEPSSAEPGVFWLGARGLERLFGTPRAWAEKILAAIEARGFESRIAVGFGHFAVYACAKALGGARVAVADDPAAEARAAAGLGLARLPIDPAARDALAKLAITTLGAFARLPAGGILRRFGADVQRLHRMARGAFDDRIAPAGEHVPLAAHVDLDAPDASIDSILGQAEELARPLCERLERCGEAASAISLVLALDDHSSLEEELRPARATCDVAWLMRLLRMRLEGRVLARGALRIEVTLARAPTSAGQADMFPCRAERSAERGRAAARAFSALRAALGEEVVVRACPSSAHLPEHSFTWERCEQLVPAEPGAVLRPPLVRRLYERPVPLPPRERREPDGWLLRGAAHGAVVELIGPYRLSGGWWRAEVKREYYFAELASGEIAWIFYDAARRRWFLQGAVS